MSPRSNVVPSHYKTMEQADVPQGRHGKHKEVVSQILRDLDNLMDGSAIKVPLAGLVESKEKVRSALNRATRKAGTERRYCQRRQLPVCMECKLLLGAAKLKYNLIVQLKAENVQLHRRSSG